jgi:hypothetical protein
MADNVGNYGFRLFRGAFADTRAPLIARAPVASGYSSTTPVGTANVGFRAGDVVNLLTDGTVQHVLAGDGTTSTVTRRPLGVVVGIDPWFDVSIGQAGALRRADNLPAGIVYGTNLERQSNLLIVPVEGSTFEVDVGGAAGAVAATQAAFQLLVGTNVDLIYNAVAPKAFPTLDSNPANYTTATRQFRVVGISPTLNNQDFTGANVKLLVVGNMVQNAPFFTTGI